MAVEILRAPHRRRLWLSNRELIEWAYYLQARSARNKTAPPVTTRLLPRWEGDDDPIVAIDMGEGEERVAVLAQQHGGKEPAGGLIARDLIRQAVQFGRLPKNVALRVYPRVNPTGHVLGIRRNGNPDKPTNPPIVGYSVEEGNPYPLHAWSFDSEHPRDIGDNTNLSWDRDDVPEVVTVREDLHGFRPTWLFDLHDMMLGARSRRLNQPDLPRALIVGAVGWVPSAEHRNRVIANLIDTGADPAAIDHFRRSPFAAPEVALNSQRLAAVVAKSMGFGATALPTAGWEATAVDYFSLHGTATLGVETQARVWRGHRRGLSAQPGSPEWLMPALERIADGSISDVDPGAVDDIPQLPYLVDRHWSLTPHQLQLARGRPTSRRTTAR